VLAIVEGSGRIVDHLGAWAMLTGQEALSMSLDPQFADPDTGDFHERTGTPLGRIKPCSAPQSDSSTSPLIDAGGPNSAFSAEPGSNGNRVNIGMYGNSAEASQGRSTPWLQVASLAQGGWVQSTATLHWVGGNFATGDLVQVEYSYNGGGVWHVLSTGVLATVEKYVWDTLSASNTPAALWRATLLADTNVTSSTTNFFAIRNAR
jgi:hypothetical protein